MRYLLDTHIDELRSLLTDIRARVINGVQTGDRLANIVSKIDSYQHHTDNPSAHPEATNIVQTPDPAKVDMEDHW